MANCPHSNTSTQVATQAIKNGDKIVSYRLLARVNCLDCGEPFHFPSLPVHNGVAGIGTNDFGLELVMPIQPGKLDYGKN